MLDLGFLFDWDGVVIDSHSQHERSWEMLSKEMRRPLPEGFFKKTFGMRNQQIIPAFFDWIDPLDRDLIDALGRRKEELYREILKKEGIEPLPGIRRLLEEMKTLGIPRAVASSTPRINIETVIQLTGLHGLFDALVSAEDVQRGKPDPDVFLKAALSIDRKPASCVVLEDAHVGIEAGRKAGCKVLAVATTHPVESLGQADAVVKDFRRISVKGLLTKVGIKPSAIPEEPPN
jgi:beta-phosphoglucomutase family hydrolase